MNEDIVSQIKLVAASLDENKYAQNRKKLIQVANKLSESQINPFLLDEATNEESQLREIPVPGPFSHQRPPNNEFEVTIKFVRARDEADAMDIIDDALQALRAKGHTHVRAVDAKDITRKSKG